MIKSGRFEPRCFHSHCLMCCFVFSFFTTSFGDHQDWWFTAAEREVVFLYGLKTAGLQLKKFPELRDQTSCVYGLFILYPDDVKSCFMCLTETPGRNRCCDLRLVPPVAIVIPGLYFFPRCWQAHHNSLQKERHHPDLQQVYIIYRLAVAPVCVCRLLWHSSSHVWGNFLRLEHDPVFAFYTHAYALMYYVCVFANCVCVFTFAGWSKGSRRKAGEKVGE